MDTLLDLISTYGYAGLFSLLVLGIVGIPVPDETLLTFAGYLVFRGQLRLVPTLAAGFLGSSCGITVSYLLGRTTGYYLVRRFGPKLHLTPERVDRVHEWFERLGRWTLTFGYFVPGVRHITAIVAGASKLEYPAFALFAYAGALAWSATFIVLGYLLGDEWDHVSGQWHRIVLILLAVAGAVAIFYILRRHYRTRRD